ncbi:MAG: hypothetical protein RID25_26285 [Cyclobacteriaceae bacterium]
MKLIKIVLLALIGLSTSLYSCDNDDLNGELSQEDREALNGLRSAYIGAFESDAALSIAVEQGDLDGVHFHDSVFHHFGSLFEEYHNDYSHANGHDDHHHDDDGMHMGANAMNMHDDQDGHHDDDHDLMNDLITDHETIQH